MEHWANMRLGKLRNNGNSCSKYGQWSSPNSLLVLEISANQFNPTDIIRCSNALDIRSCIWK